ncbi:hypothetical protein [Variovorax sp. HJSM1_2]|uniref:hypothetical protein n=1 Tax=Variovorax sp. HJSM1_2 TaxID=3366263 RepID=UPI003BBB4237
MNNRSNWRSVRLAEHHFQHQIRARHALWLHGWCIGLLTLGFTWGTSTLLMHLGVQSLALRYLLSLGVGYAVYLLVLRAWAAAMLRRSESGDADLSFDLPTDGTSGCGNGPGVHAVPGGMDAGGGGDFAGAGASGDFASGALEAAASADEGAVIAIPVVAVFLIVCALLFGAGGLLLLYFGSEALLAVVVELAFSYAASRVAVRVVREGWLLAAVQLTWKPLLGALFCAVLLGLSIDHFVPAADSLPHALQLMRGR